MKSKLGTLTGSILQKYTGVKYKIKGNFKLVNLMSSQKDYEDD